jgi:hypothetical protein
MIEVVDESSNDSADSSEAVAIADHIVDGDEIIGALVVLFRSNGDVNIGTTSIRDSYLVTLVEHMADLIVKSVDEEKHATESLT